NSFLNNNQSKFIRIIKSLVENIYNNPDALMQNISKLEYLKLILNKIAFDISNKDINIKGNDKEQITKVINGLNQYLINVKRIIKNNYYEEELTSLDITIGGN